MFSLSHLWIWLHIRLQSLVPFALPVATPTTTSSPDPNAADISTFFNNLTKDLLVFALAMAGFFFALSALLYMSSGATGNERTRQHAIGALYAALGGLALALLSGSIAALVNGAAGK